MEGNQALRSVTEEVEAHKDRCSLTPGPGEGRVTTVRWRGGGWRAASALLLSLLSLFFSSSEEVRKYPPSLHQRTQALCWQQSERWRVELAHPPPCPPPLHRPSVLGRDQGRPARPP